MPTYRTKDHPESNGGIPKTGDTQWSVKFPLENGEELIVLMGDEGFSKLKQVVMDQIIDQATDPNYNKSVDSPGVEPGTEKI